MRARFYSSGKLLISGEYAVLDGVWGLAIPTKYGQQLIVEPTDRPGIHWKSKDQDGSTWNLDTGRAAAGPRQGAELETVAVTAVFWFAWSGFYPNTQVID